MLEICLEYETSRLRYSYEKAAKESSGAVSTRLHLSGLRGGEQLVGVLSCVEAQVLESGNSQFRLHRNFVSGEVSSDDHGIGLFRINVPSDTNQVVYKFRRRTLSVSLIALKNEIRKEPGRRQSPCNQEPLEILLEKRHGRLEELNTVLMDRLSYYFRSGDYKKRNATCRLAVVIFNLQTGESFSQSSQEIKSYFKNMSATNGPFPDWESDIEICEKNLLSIEALRGLLQQTNFYCTTQMVEYYTPAAPQWQYQPANAEDALEQHEYNVGLTHPSRSNLEDTVYSSESPDLDENFFIVAEEVLEGGLLDKVNEPFKPETAALPYELQPQNFPQIVQCDFQQLQIVLPATSESTSNDLVYFDFDEQQSSDLFCAMPAPQEQCYELNFDDFEKCADCCSSSDVTAAAPCKQDMQIQELDQVMDDYLSLYDADQSTVVANPLPVGDQMQFQTYYGGQQTFPQAFQLANNYFLLNPS